MKKLYPKSSALGEWLIMTKAQEWDIILSQYKLYFSTTFNAMKNIRDILTVKTKQNKQKLIA